jgi:hypothetical protein
MTPEILTVTAKTPDLQMKAEKREKKTHLIRLSLLATDWKSRIGHVVQIGIEDVIDELNQIALWVGENRDRDVIAIDNLKHQKDSFLDGLKAQSGAHYHVPRTMQGNVRLFDEAPVLHDPILFLHVATSNRAEIEPVIDNVEPGTIVLGSVDACRIVLEAAQCKAQPLYFHGDDLSLRVVV